MLPQAIDATLRAAFDDNFSSGGELGASVSVWQDGRELANFAAGWCDRDQTQAWTADTPVLFWSATKGLASASVLHALQEGGLNPITLRVAKLWPEFAQAGKEDVTVGQLMSHQAGLSVLTEAIEVWDYDRVVAALAAEAPHWVLGHGHGYHPRTFGFLMDELVRRITGVTLRNYWRRIFAEPLGIDVWIGVPEEDVDRVAPVFPAKGAPSKDDLFYHEFFRAGSFTARAFTSPRGLHSAAALNKPEALTVGFPGFGGVGTARGLAKFYAMLAAGGSLDGRRYFEPASIDHMAATLVQGPDRVLHLETAFSCGFMRDPLDPNGKKIRKIFGPSLSAFGHPGAGGSHAFADPENGLAFAYVMNQMEPGVLPSAKAMRLVDATYGREAFHRGTGLN
ncbi:MAG TPA: serine hydrolase domain-containing protein [Chthoniobacteraceae bacterium]|nr:serine hydrolase domain-containing protein [Chthoniobacteraceae bacterium]